MLFTILSIVLVLALIGGLPASLRSVDLSSYPGARARILRSRRGRR